MEDAQTLIGGGSVTLSMALALATYYVLSNDQILRTLTNELTAAIRSPARFLSLINFTKLEYSGTLGHSMKIVDAVKERDVDM